MAYLNVSPVRQVKVARVKRVVPAKAPVVSRGAPVQPTTGQIFPRGLS